jgi:hypothetical protein
MCPCEKEPLTPLIAHPQQEGKGKAQALITASRVNENFGASGYLDAQAGMQLRFPVASALKKTVYKDHPLVVTEVQAGVPKGFLGRMDVSLAFSDHEPDALGGIPFRSLPGG